MMVLNTYTQLKEEILRCIDTPGVGSVFEHNTDVAYQYLPKSDAALFLLSVDQPVSKAELEKPIISEVKEALTVWRRQEDEKLAGAFETACKRFIGRIDAIVDGISRAIETGLARKSTGEKAVEERKAQLLDQGKTLKNLRETLERIRQKIAA